MNNSRDEGLKLGDSKLPVKDKEQSQNGVSRFRLKSMNEREIRVHCTIYFAIENREILSYSGRLDGLGHL